jgi:glycopeptide antibiotics resistance protein
VIALATVTQLRMPAAGEIAGRLGRALDPSVSGGDVVDAARNIVLFLGWGVVWVVTAARLRTWHVLRDAVVSGAALSAAVEALQLLSPFRRTSVLDLMSNTAGAAAGAVVTLGVLFLLAWARRRKSFVGVPAVLFAAGYGGAVALEAVTPLLRQERWADAWGPPGQRFAIAFRRLDPASWSQLGAIDLLLFVPAGFLAVTALVELGWSYRRAAPTVAIVGVIASPLLELLRGAGGFILAYGPMVTHAVGFAAGAGLAAWSLPWLTRTVRGRFRPLGLLAVYGLIVLVWWTRPFYLERSLAGIAENLSPERFLPLQAYRDRFDLHSAADATIAALLFLPLGTLLAVWPLRRSGPFRGLLPGVLLALFAESLQIVLAARTFDLTDVLIASAAMGVGCALARRAGYAPYGELLPAVSPQARSPPGAAR